MAYPIQSLKTAMVLAMLCLPIGLGVNVSYFLSGAIKRKKISTSYLGLIISYSTILAVAVLARIVHPEWVRIRLDVLGIMTATVLGIVCICIEYLAGVLLTLFFTRQRVFKLSVHSVYSDTQKADMWDVVFIGVFVILEELVFRTAVINILFGLEFPTVAIVVIAISVFALNHVQWGLFALIQKMFSGCVFVLLYLLFDYNILIPVIAHCVQNYTLLWLRKPERLEILGRRRKNE
jgi:membrane protease YdiL (CAAX protease family)